MARRREAQGTARAGLRKGNTWLEKRAAASVSGTVVGAQTIIAISTMTSRYAAEAIISSRAMPEASSPSYSPSRRAT
jgi:hypothetical protein